MNWKKKPAIEPQLLAIPGITEEEAESIRQADIPNATRFQEALDDGDVAILQGLHQRTGLAPERLAQLQANWLDVTYQPLKGPIIRRYWADIFLASVLLLLALTAAWPWIRQASPRVLAAAEIPAFTVIDQPQLRIAGNVSADQATEMFSHFNGKYTRTLIRKDDPIPVEIDSFRKVSLADRTIVRLQAKNLPRIEGHSRPQNVNLIFSSRIAALGAIVPALLLDLDSDSSTITVALSAEDIRETAKWLGNSDLYMALKSP